MTSTVDLEVGDKLLLLGEHRLQRVQLRLQLLNGDLRLALGSGRVLGVGNLYYTIIVRYNKSGNRWYSLNTIKSPSDIRHVVISLFMRDTRKQK